LKSSDLRKLILRGESETLEFKASGNSDRVGDRVGENLSENQKKIINALTQEPRMSALKLSLVLGISLRKTEENISKLKENGLLVRVGPDKGGRWKVVERELKE
jgi:ATP-dependent DNA helicase RecG